MSRQQDLSLRPCSTTVMHQGGITTILELLVMATDNTGNSSTLSHQYEGYLNCQPKPGCVPRLLPSLLSLYRHLASEDDFQPEILGRCWTGNLCGVSHVFYDFYNRSLICVFEQKTALRSFTDWSPSLCRDGGGGPVSAVALSAPLTLSHIKPASPNTATLVSTHP